MPLHVVRLAKTNQRELEVLADGMKIGFAVQDEEGFHLNISGVTAMLFPRKNDMVLWLLKKIDTIFPEVRRYKLSRVNRANTR